MAKFSNPCHGCLHYKKEMYDGFHIVPSKRFHCDLYGVICKPEYKNKASPTLKVQQLEFNFNF